MKSTSIDPRDYKFIPCKKEIYDSPASYPSEQAKITEISCAGYGDRHVVVAVYPVTYHPTEDSYDFCEDIELTLSYNHSPQRKQALNRKGRAIDIGIPFYEYCVITSLNLKPAFTRLIAWKREKGLNAGIVCKEDILDNAYIVGDTVSVSSQNGSILDDDAGKIRQYLQYAYASGTTKYVLFGGNYQIMPIRYGTGNNNTWNNNNKIPSDFYFSELNSNWNYDGDQYLGERNNDIMDYGSELFVGRLLCTNIQELHNYTDKLLRYELNPGNGDFSYLQKALYTQSDEIQKSHVQDTIAAQLHCIFPVDTIFSEYPSCDTLNPESPSGNDVIAEMNEHYGYVSWGGHGGPYTVMMKTSGLHLNHIYAITSVQADTTDITYIMQESANGLDNLTNKYYPMFAYSIACTITPFDIYHNYGMLYNMGQSFTLGKDYGGPVLVGNTRNGWVDDSKDLQLVFNDYLINNPLVGAAQNYAKMNCRSHYLRHSSNIIGCPNIRIWTDTPKLFSAALTYNANNYIITANNSITDAEIGIRDITLVNEVTDTIYFSPSQGTKTLTNVENCLITLMGKNCLPQIMPLTLQNSTLQGTHYAIAKDVTCGKDIRDGTQGNVIFDDNSDYTFETKGTFKLTQL